MTPAPRSLHLLSLSLACVAVTAGALAQDPAPVPQRGELLENPPVMMGSYTVGDLLGKVTGGEVPAWLVTEVVTPQCSVTVYQLRYGTIGAKGEPTTASGALMIPTGATGKCRGPRPVVMYAHGKRNLKSTNIADLSGDNYEGLMIALTLAGEGYIVVAPNYVGYDTSTLPYQTFLVADQQSADMMDALRAAHTALVGMDTPINRQLFVTGYSQGGHVAMATHRALEAAGVPVTASAPMSGPYALSAFADAVFMGQVGGGAVEEFAMLASSFQNAYGNLYADPAEMFEPAYVGAPALFPSTASGDTLVAQGLLPDDAIFSSTPPTPELAPLTPATAPAEFADVFAKGFGTDHLITNSYRQGYLQDQVAAPDEGYPNTTTGLPPANPVHTLRQALKKNDLRNWAPVAPVLLCAGAEDPVVFFFNSELMQGYWAANAPASQVTFLNVDSPPTEGSPYQDLQERFARTKDLVSAAAVLEGAQDGGRAAVLDDYHDVLVPAYCIQATRSFFDSLVDHPVPPVEPAKTLRRPD